MEYDNGDRYEGQWNGQNYHGEGVLFYKNGEITCDYYENSIIKENYISCYKKSAVVYPAYREKEI